MNGMNSHAQGCADYHREQLGIKTPEELRIEQLEADVETLQRERDQWEINFALEHDDVVQLQAELAECKRDAERYRTLRDVKYQLDEDDPCVSDSFFSMFYGEELDHSIDQLKARYDSAIAAQKGEWK